MKFLNLLIIMMVASCSTLDESNFDRSVRYQGTYQCKPFSKEDPKLKETLAEADVGRIRCAKDEWRIEPDQIVFTRSLFQSKNCDGILGRIVYSVPLKKSQEKFHLTQIKCHLVRKNPGWTAEDSGKCMLHKLTLNMPYPTSVLASCSTYIPQVCLTEGSSVTVQSADQTTDGREPFDRLEFNSNPGKPETCSRYGG